MYKHSACSSAITPSFSSSPSSLHPFPAHVPFLSPSLTHPVFHSLSDLAAILGSNLHAKWWNHTDLHLCPQNTPSPHLNLNRTFKSVSHTLTHTHSHTSAHTVLFKTQTYFPINNACWSHCSRRSRANGRLRGGTRPSKLKKEFTLIKSLFILPNNEEQ